MRRPRFHLPGATPGARLPLPDEEGAHARRVLRLRPGADVEVFDGDGHAYAGVVAGISRTELSVEVGQPVEPPAPELPIAITLAMGVLKGDHMDAVVRDAAMLGVAAIVPVVTARSETTPAALIRGRRRERWTRIAVSSVKQCGRATVPAVAEPVDVAAWLATAGTGPVIACLEPSAEVPARAIQMVGRPPGGAVTVAVGPEGGWTPDEARRLAAAGEAVYVGRRILRAEAAPLVVLAALITAWNLE